MALTSAILGPSCQLVIRNLIARHATLADAGLWEGMNRISNMYLMVITTSFSVYYLPRLSGLKSDREVKEEVFRVYKFLVPFLTFTLILIYFFRNVVIHILFNSKFYGMDNLFAYQLLGDFFKMTTWVLGYLFLARTMTKYYIAMEFLGSILYITLSMIFVINFGTVGATIGFAIGYIITFFIHLLIFRKLLFTNEK
jgi:PST family polysaccharide transporter